MLPAPSSNQMAPAKRKREDNGGGHDEGETQYKNESNVQLRRSLRHAQAQMIVWGAAQDGSMGLGDVFECPMPLPLLLRSGSIGDSVRQIACGGSSTLCSTESGRVFSCGNNDDSATGRPAWNHGELEVTEGALSPEILHPISIPAPAVAISAGDSHGAFTTDTGELWGFGKFRQGDGTSSFSSTSSVAPEPVKFVFPWPQGTEGKEVVAIASGANFLLALTDDGTVLSVGVNANGVLGRLTPASVDSLKTHTATKDAAVAAVAAAALAEAEATAVNTASGMPGACPIATEEVEAAAEAAAKNQELRQAKLSTAEAAAAEATVRLAMAEFLDASTDLVFTEVTFPRSTPLQAIPTVTAIIAGDSHCLALTVSEVFAWGSNTHGQMGIPSAYDVISYLPKRVDALCGRGIVAGAAGNAFTILLDINGKVWTFGKYAHGPLGREVGNPQDPGTLTLAVDPTAIRASSVAAELVGAADKARAAGVTESAGLNLWERTAQAGGVTQSGTSAKFLASVDRKDDLPHPVPLQVTALPGKAVAVAAGSSNSAAVMASGELFTWGAGLSFMLGRGANENDAMAPVLFARPENREFVAVSFGGQHGVALTRASTGGSRVPRPAKRARVQE